MLKFLLIVALTTITSAAPAPGLLHGTPSITSSSNSVVHSAVLAPTVHVAPATIAASSLHGLALPGNAYSATALATAVSLDAGGLHGGLLGAPALSVHSGLAAPVSVLGHGILAGDSLGLGLHGLH